MEDLTKPFKFKNKAKQLEFDIPNIPKAGFIASRMNKDNFWNLAYFVGMFSGISAAFAINAMILSWITIAGVIWLVKRNSNIVFDKEKLEFVINGNKKIKASGTEFMLLMFLSLGIMAIVGFVLDALKVDDSPLILAIMMSLLILLPVLYCILRNLPIAVYFKKEAWSKDGSNDSKKSPSCSQGSNKSLLSLDRMRNDPINKWNSINIYHKR